ncbi:DNA helicase II [Alteromonas sp. KS69]|jgi:DNA helicase-2/ATP-dependent DNA helicase PcrA|uniref:DNA 3'-5' helicase n=1 Tax=Alteromonas naphthalenivorans TaxID=715451 RepID=F5ZFE7_ALTNA|nr:MULTISPECIES: DNA helicase II [Alteromonas]MBB66330.1 DNA helicase II [Rickettsiales bacterium]AEF05003.1 DNA helicase II [Alteromonas naphthalenivorans]MBO7921982.1 DNA helicase II [Alteromonas sp. K632G]RUP80752.1 DNA helicase II [Alteromonas sp. KS69]VEL95265.1 ATP-dependent DNA helicase UvrD [Alteromonas sp. 76-1]|tara:strand:- start:2305 stop:4476 length:2172 start_codon:yes stop_codon:yes gene_type:complete
MDVSRLLDELNDKQREAVAAPLSNALILAGAGSGKTRVLVHRIAWLMEVENIAPFSILAVTFTNKAAKEMRGRIESLMGRGLNNMWIGTFHGLAHRLLRAHHAEANLPENFQILDSDDQYRLIKRILKAMNLDEKHWVPRQIQWYINGNKDEGLRPQHIETHNDQTQQKMREIYAAYQDACDRSGLVDFAELLLRAHELWAKNPEVLANYQRRFRAVLVDEFQDTNNIQYAWLRMLCSGNQNNIMIVGDDDQSIYGWRGANVDNIQHFLKDFNNPTTIRLEQNYRSTGTILKAANTVIDNNTGRLGKELWTDGNDGEPISVYAGFNELDEARFIVSKIKDWLNQGNALKDTAILYRNNAQSRVLEEALLHQGTPYRIYGGLRFFERQEIKDALGYLRMMNHPHDDAAFERVVNTPTRGMGEKTLSQVREAARTHNCSMWQASQLLINENALKGRALNALQSFVLLVTELEQATVDEPLEKHADVAIRQSGLYAMYQAERGEKAQARLENLEELVTACKQFTVPDEAEEMTPLSAFLAHASLEAGETQAGTDQDAVQMMTIHTAKGLEFPMVFMAGVEEGMFPSQMTNDEPGRMEEERRLCYVGMTRAMEKLYITYAESRRLYGQDKYHTASRFIREIPADCVEEVRLKSTISRPIHNRFSQATSHASFEETGFQLGQKVVHRKFGEGIVLNYEGSGEHARVQVNFDEFGTKWLVLAYAKLEKA